MPANSPESIATRRLLPFANEILSRTFETIVANCRKKDILPILVFMPVVGESGFEHETPAILRIANEAGFLVWDLGDVFKGYPDSAIWLAEWDTHPNTKGHQLVADHLYDLFAKNAGEIFTESLTLGANAATQPHFDESSKGPRARPAYLGREGNVQ